MESKIPPMSYSMMVDANTPVPNPENTPYTEVQPRQIYSWVKDEMVSECHGCGETFTMIIRKHHCRICGRIYCYRCTTHRMRVPKCIQSQLPIPVENLNQIQRALYNLNPMRLVEYYQSNSAQISRSVSPILEQGLLHIPNILDTGKRALHKTVGSPNSNYLLNRVSMLARGRKGSDEDGAVRVCNKCSHKMSQVYRLEQMISVFALLELDILDWKRMSAVSHTWQQIGNYFLSRFREIQYYLPGHRMNPEDRRLLWINRRYLIGHSIWTVQLLRSIDQEEQYDLRQEHLRQVMQLIQNYTGYNGLHNSMQTGIEIGKDASERRLRDVTERQWRDADERRSISHWRNVSEDRARSLERNVGENSHSSIGDSQEGVEMMQENRDRSLKRPKTIEEHMEEGQPWIKIDQQYSHMAKSLDEKYIQNILGEEDDWLGKDLVGRGGIKSLAIGCGKGVNDWRSECLENAIEMQDFGRVEKRQATPELIQGAIQNKEKRRLDCWHLMCSRHCQVFLRPEDSLSLLDHTVQSRETREFAIKHMSVVESSRLRLYLPLLVHYMRYETRDGSIIGDYILRRILGAEVLDPYLANDLYWQLKVNLESKSYFAVYKHYFDRFLREIRRDLLEVILKGQRFVNILDDVTNTEGDVMETRYHLAQDLNPMTLPNLSVPSQPFYDYYDIDLEGVHKKHSATEPLLIPLRYQIPVNDRGKNGNEFQSGLYSILYKSEDVRKDQIIMKIIGLMDKILQEEENLHLNIVTYEIRPTSSRSGIIEMVPDCATMYQIKERMHFSVLNWIIENNPSTPMHQLRNRFLESCAAYCVITYLLGIGDRHLDNIMVTKEGVMFHIDYGYILGHEPKPMSSPQIRIDPDMVDALGGTESQYFAEFKILCNRIFNCLRRHVNLFIHLLNMLIEVDPPIDNRSRQELLDEIIRRFIPGENYEEAELVMSNQIEKSSSANYGQYLSDFVHYHVQENTVGETLKSTVKGTQSLFGSLASYWKG